MDAHTFAERLNGRFDGLIRLHDLDQLCQHVAARDGWFLVEPGRESPVSPVNGEAARCHLERLVEEILTEERGVWTTMVYAQSFEQPDIIKVFHPRRAGCGCGGKGGVLPWWVMTRVAPGVVPAWEHCPTLDRPSWWRQLL